MQIFVFAIRLALLYLNYCFPAVLLVQKCAVKSNVIALFGQRKKYVFLFLIRIKKVGEGIGVRKV